MNPLHADHGAPVPTQSNYWTRAAEPITPSIGENHLRNIRQLTFGGQNAEAYWSADGNQIIYQTRQPEFPDEQIVIMNADGSGKRLVSTGQGRCTCSYWTPDGKWLYFSSTHDKNKGAQPPIDHSQGYVWMVNPQFSLYRMPINQVPTLADFLSRIPTTGINPVTPELVLDKGGYVAETTISPDGKTMFFTGNFEGDLEIYRADLNGKNIRKLTNDVGYDGGPFISWDGKSVVYRRGIMNSEKDVTDYQALLSKNMVRPSKLEIWLMDSFGNNKRQVTTMNAASFAPFLHPDNKRIIFSSNFGDKKGREFELWMIRTDGSHLERVTRTADFDGFPMFSRDGKKVVWASNRNGSVRGETNIFIADWVD